MKNSGWAIFRTAVFWNHDHISDQTKPNQTSPSGILHFASHSLRAYHKKFQVSRSNGSRDNGSGKFKIWKLSILGFFEKGPPEPPQKVKKWFQWYFWLSGTHMGPKNFFVDFRDGGSKSVYRLTERRLLHKNSFIIKPENVHIFKVHFHLKFKCSFPYFWIQ